MVMGERLVLIIAMPGTVRKGIQALVEALPEVNKVICINEIPQNPGELEGVDPALIVVEFPEDEKSYQQLLEIVRGSVPSAKILALVDNKEQERAANRLKTDGTLMKGFEGSRFLKILGRLIRSVKN